MNIDARRQDLLKRAKTFHEAEFHYQTPQERTRALTSVRLSMGDYIKDDRTRRLVLGWIFIRPGIELSTANLTDGQLEALRKWLAILPVGDGSWSISEIASGELKLIARECEMGMQPIVKEAIKLGGTVKHARQVEKNKPTDYFEFDA